MNINGIRPIYNLIHSSIYLILLNNMFMVSIRYDIITNIPFHYSGSFLVILIITSNMDFVDTS